MGILEAKVGMYIFDSLQLCAFRALTAPTWFEAPKMHRSFPFFEIIVWQTKRFFLGTSIDLTNTQEGDLFVSIFIYGRLAERCLGEGR
jgi:hypothetical protein